MIIITTTKEKQEKKNRIIFQLTVDFQRGRSVLYCEENSSILYIVGTNEHSARRVRYKLELFPTQSRANLSLWKSTVKWKWIIFYFSMGLMNYQQFFSSVLILWKPKGIFSTFFSSILILCKPKGIFSKLFV